MYKVICVNCEEVRTVKAKKSWMKGIEPYEKICKSCSMKGKVKSEEHKNKLSESIKKLQTADVLQRKSQYMLEHPEHWFGKLNQGGAEQYCVGREHSEETKRKISEGVKQAKNKRRG